MIPLRQSLPAKDSQQNIKNLHFIYDYIYLSNYIWTPENGGAVYKNGCNISILCYIFVQPLKGDILCPFLQYVI